MTNMAVIEKKVSLEKKIGIQKGLTNKANQKKWYIC